MARNYPLNIIFSLLLAITVQQKAECQFLDKFKLGVSYVWLTFDDQIDPWRESTLQVDIGVSASKSIYLGLHYVLIDSWYAVGPKEHTDAFQYGAYLEYYPVLPWGIRPYFVASYDRGNYCTCSDFKSVAKDGLDYVSLGGGARYSLYKDKLLINVEFTSSHILGQVERKNAYNRPSVGLDLLF